MRWDKRRVDQIIDELAMKGKTEQLGKSEGQVVWTREQIHEFDDA